jgi:hypothetical protein
MLLRRALGANVESAWPRSHPNAYPASHSNGSGFANGHWGDPDHASFFYGRSSHRNPGSYAHPIRSSKPNAFVYSDTHRNPNGHADSYHNANAKFNSYCYVNFNGDDDTHSDACPTYIDAGATHGHPCSTELHANGHCHSNFDGHVNSHSDPDCYGYALKDGLWICFPI